MGRREAARLDQQSSNSHTEWSMTPLCGLSHVPATISCERHTKSRRHSENGQNYGKFEPEDRSTDGIRTPWFHPVSRAIRYLCVEFSISVPSCAPMTVSEIVSQKRHLHHVQTSKEDVTDLDNGKCRTTNSESTTIWDGGHVCRFTGWKWEFCRGGWVLKMLLELNRKDNILSGKLYFVWSVL